MLTYLRFYSILKKQNRPASELENNLLQSLCVKRTPTLFKNPSVSTPMLIGISHPAIILPDRDYDELQLRNILSHELTHLKRFDIAVKWLMTIANAIHWFNPIIYLVRSNVNRACEMACDEAVIRKLDISGKKIYGNILISFVAESHNLLVAPSITMCEEKKTLKERLESIMKYQSKPKKAVILSITILLVLVIFSLTLGASFAGKNNQDSSSLNKQIQFHISSTPTQNAFPKFSDSEVLAARSIVEKYWRAQINKDDNSLWATLLGGKPANAMWSLKDFDVDISQVNISYNPQDSDRLSYLQHGGGANSNISIENVIVFKVDFNVKFTGSYTGPWSEGNYTGWSMTLVRKDKNSPWLISATGYC
ncbi:MAG: M56 family metallopeptidase [Bacillota bacterium]|nr:M56 family metallopeptidase [Bacillota bacterium]